MIVAEGSMPSIEEYARRPREERLTRIDRTPDELTDACIAPMPSAWPPPAPKSWAATEVICHLRTTRSGSSSGCGSSWPWTCPVRCHESGRWADERQYLTNDGILALAAFRPSAPGDPRVLASARARRVGARRRARRFARRRTIDEFYP